MSSEQIRELWMLLCNSADYDSWGDDDNGRFIIIVDNIKDLIKIKNKTKVKAQAILDVIDLYSHNEE